VLHVNQSKKNGTVKEPDKMGKGIKKKEAQKKRLRLKKYYRYENYTSI
jgi:hypothetical protein